MVWISILNVPYYKICQFRRNTLDKPLRQIDPLALLDVPTFVSCDKLSKTTETTVALTKLFGKVKPDIDRSVSMEYNASDVLLNSKLVQMGKLET